MDIGVIIEQKDEKRLKEKVARKNSIHSKNHLLRFIFCALILPLKGTNERGISHNWLRKVHG